MSVALFLALGAAEQLERSVGSAAALAAYRQLVRSAGDEPIRARAILGGLRCAARLADAAQLGALTEQWRHARPGREGEPRAFSEIVEIAEALARRGILRAAIDLAGAEVDRAPSARSLYLLGRCLELAEAPGAPVAYGRAESAAGREPVDPEAFVAARTRRLKLLAASPATLDLAVEAASALSAASPPAPFDKGGAAEVFEAARTALSAEDRLALALLGLRAPGRFARASALSTLGDVAERSPALRRNALLAAARHVDAWGPTLSAVEAERAAAVLRLAEDPSARDEALRRLARIRTLGEASPSARASALLDAAAATPETRRLLEQARSLLLDEAPHSSPRSSPAFRGVSSGIAEGALAALAALRAPRPAEAERLLLLLADEVANADSGPLPAPAWTAACVGLGVAPARAAAAKLAERLLAARLGVPPRGFVDLARRLRAAGRADAAALAWRRAAEAREAGASDELVRDLRALARRLALDAEALRARGAPAEARGKRDRALELLREARALARQDARGKAR